MSDPAVVELFDAQGVRLPSDDDVLRNRVVKPDWNFHFDAPRLEKIDQLEPVLSRYQRFLPKDTKLPDLQEFFARFMALVEIIRARPDMSEILHGPCLPLAFAAGEIKADQLGDYLESRMLPGVKAAYEQQFAGRNFRHYCSGGDVTGQVKSVLKSNFKLLLENLAEGWVVGAYFPLALFGWSVMASRKQMSTLPQDLHLVLSDAIINAHAIMGHSDVLCRDFHVPGMDCSANIYQSPESTLVFEAYNNGLGFSDAGNLAHACDSWSSGLLMIS